MLYKTSLVLLDFGPTVFILKVSKEVTEAKLGK